MRTANWFGISNIFLSKECVDPYNSKVIRSAMGAHFKMNIVIDNIKLGISNLKSQNFKIITTDLNAKNIISDFKIEANCWALVMGSEAHGISNEIAIKNMILL